MLNRIQLKAQGDLAGAKAWGRAGSYRFLAGEAEFELDPKAEPARRVRDIQHCSLSTGGKVSFQCDFVVFRPKDLSRSSGLVLMEVVNRGYRLLPWLVQRAPFSRDPVTEEALGDGLLLNAGHVIVWLGWQWDVPKATGRLRAELPRAIGLSGVVRSEFVCDAPASTFSLGDGDHTAYPVSDEADPRIRLTVRDSAYGGRTAIPRDQWRFGRDKDGPSDRASVYVAAGLTPGRIYEVVYPSRDPVVCGLGMAGIRDFGSFLKYGGGAQAPGELLEIHQHAHGAALFGASQSGRFVRHFLYDGFNRDEQGAKVFDGAWAHLAGAARGSFNHRFAQPSRGADPQVNHDYPTFLSPFSDRGLLSACHEQHSVPKLFCTNTSYEYWAFCASLIHTTADGRNDVQPEATTRLYHLAGAQHVPGPWPPVKAGTRYEHNSNDFGWILRGLMECWTAWILSDTEPPASTYPTLRSGTLVPAAKSGFPASLAPVPAPYHTRRVDYGPEFLALGVIQYEPPRAGKAYPSLVPRVDADGNEVSGVRTPFVAVPTGTFAGWNYRAAETGSPQTLADNVGSYFEFAKSPAERTRTGDGRASMAERYKNLDDYERKVAAHIEQLIRQGFVRSGDAASMVAQCRGRWPGDAKR